MTGERLRPLSPGSLRPSQLISTFGPGALVQMERDSVIVMGIDTWSESERHYKKLSHPHLEALLDKDHFKMPRPTDKAQVVSCRSFPRWGVCSNPACCRLQRHGAALPVNEVYFTCCECRRALYPASFVATCERGHLDEFPWARWAHSNVGSGEPCSEPVLRFRARGKSPGLADCFVSCDGCGALRSCGGITSPSGLMELIPACTGRTPWLERDVPGDCREKPTPMRGIQTLSTSLYYPSVISALYIPEWLHPIQKTITENKIGIKAQLDMSTLADVAKRSPIFADARNAYSVGEITRHLQKRFELNRAANRDATEGQIRRKEYDDLIYTEFEGDDVLDIADVTPDSSISEYVSDIRRINRITEIRVIRSFLRGEAPDPYAAAETEHNYCRISQRKTDWYPAVENRGEGFLFTLDEGRLEKWEKQERVASRCDNMISAYEEWSHQRGWNASQNNNPRYILLHTIAHAMIRTVASVSGYNEAAIRERIYCDKGHGGILLYTASPSSDGSLGGLVRQASSDNFASLFRSTVKNSRYCSRDPLCRDSLDHMQDDVPLHARLNGSACYGCMLLPETSCENVNRFLDRALMYDETVGFFADWDADCLQA